MPGAPEAARHPKNSRALESGCFCNRLDKEYTVKSQVLKVVSLVVMQCVPARKVLD